MVVGDGGQQLCPIMKSCDPPHTCNPNRTDNLFSNHTKKNNKEYIEGFTGGAVVESLPANAGDTGSSPGLGGSHMPRNN